MRFKLPIIVSALAVILGACGDSVPSANRTYISPRGSIQALKDASRQGVGVPVFVANSPFGTALDSAERFTESLKITASNPSFRFTPIGEPLAPEGTRVVVVFNPPDGRSAISFCQGEFPKAEPEKDVLKFRIAVCKGDRRLVEVTARMKTPQTSDDMAFEDLRRLATRLLIEQEDRTPN